MSPSSGAVGAGRREVEAVAGWCCRGAAGISSVHSPCEHSSVVLLALKYLVVIDKQRQC